MVSIYTEHHSIHQGPAAATYNLHCRFGKKIRLMFLQRFIAKLFSIKLPNSSKKLIKKFLHFKIFAF